MGPSRVEELLRAPLAGGRVELVAKAALASRGQAVAFANYLRFLRAAVSAEPPPYDEVGYAETYELASADPKWLIISLMTNSEREGDGATRLWSLASCTNDQEKSLLLKKHAADESRHALAYLSLMDAVFPGAVSPKFRKELNALSPKYSMHQELCPVAGSPYARPPTLDDFVQMNIAEIRTTIHHLMQRAALKSHCSRVRWSRAERILDSILIDELEHVGYTAAIVEEAARNCLSTKIGEIIRKRMANFNQITLSELKALNFE